jgi:hypothetical protein
MTTVVVLQSSYIPWKGYFDLVHDSDKFVFYDDVQFTSRDWRSRNRIKTHQGSAWLTIPVGADRSRLIHEVGVVDSHWQAKHWRSIKQSYGKCPAFPQYEQLFEHLYLGCTWTNLSEMNQALIKVISTECLSINTEFHDSREYAASGAKLDRLIDLVVKTGAHRYVSGPSAQSYIDAGRFSVEGVELVWKDYSGYPEYPQRYPPFDHAVSILDLLFNVGLDAPWYIWGWRDGSKGPG